MLVSTNSFQPIHDHDHYLIPYQNAHRAFHPSRHLKISQTLYPFINGGILIRTIGLYP